jgi:hypothetical protein
MRPLRIHHLMDSGSHPGVEAKSYPQAQEYLPNYLTSLLANLLGTLQ